MGKVIKKIFLPGLLFAFFTMIPSFVYATTINFSVPAEKIYSGDTFIVEVKISSPDRLINAAEGVLFFDKDILGLKELSTGNSVFSVWAEEPSFSNKNGKVSFVGGTPDGFQGTEAEVLKIIFLAKKSGNAELTPTSDFAVFLSDGKGTKDDLLTKEAVISVLPRPADQAPVDEWEKIVANDKTSPKDFEVFLYRDPVMFDNKYFLSFFTTDEGTGVDRYEVKEGDRQFVEGKSPYVLQDQSLKSVVYVKAVDKAGNERVEKAPREGAKTKMRIYLISIAAAVIVAVLAAVVYISIKKRKNKKRGNIGGYGHTPFGI